MVKRSPRWFEPFDRRHLNPDACIWFDDRLEHFGYAHDDAYLYADIGYAVRSFQAFRVEKGFPRIVSSDLQRGVSEVHYSLSIASCGPFRMKEQQPTELLEGFA